MVTTTMNTFVSTTVQCARCHHHKFDPVRMDDYYSLQAVLPPWIDRIVSLMRTVVVVSASFCRSAKRN